MHLHPTLSNAVKYVPGDTHEVSFQRRCLDVPAEAILDGQSSFKENRGWTCVPHLGALCSPLCFVLVWFTQQKLLDWVCKKIHYIKPVVKKYANSHRVQMMLRSFLQGCVKFSPLGPKRTLVDSWTCNVIIPTLGMRPSHLYQKTPSLMAQVPKDMLCLPVTYNCRIWLPGMRIRWVCIHKEMRSKVATRD